MDPLSAILAAILAGAAAGAGEIVKDEVTGAYAAMRERLRQAFGKDLRVETAVDAVEEAPKGKSAATNLSLLLQEVGAADDAELVRLSAQVLDAAKQRPFYRNVIQAAEEARVRSSGIRLAGGPVDGNIDNSVRAEKGAEIDDSGISIG